VVAATVARGAISARHRSTVVGPKSVSAVILTTMAKKMQLLQENDSY
jgi:hypothetical protein